MSTTNWDYVIIGAGVAGASAVTGIRESDPDGSILLLGAEPDPPVYRPDLSKTLWLEDKELSGSELLGDDVRVDLRTRTEVDAIDPGEHTVSLADGSTLGYGKLLLATGSRPRTLPLEGERVVYYRTAADYRRVRELATSGAHVIVVGGGYIGSEMAAALAQQDDVRVTLVTEDELVLSHMLPEGLARRVGHAFEDHDVELRTGLVRSGEARADGVTLTLDDGSTLSADAAVIGIGVLPRSDLAQAAGIQVDDGVVVDATGATSAPDVFAAGDVASYPDALLGRRRVEHVDNAESMGRLVGRVMAGADESYTHTPFFWSDIFDDGYEAIGELSTRLEVVEDFPDGDRGAGVVYYLDGGRVRGVLLWNTWDSVPKAQDLIERTAQEPVTDPASLKGSI